MYNSMDMSRNANLQMLAISLAALLAGIWPASPALGQIVSSPIRGPHPPSPCPSVFAYEGSVPEKNRWHGVVLLSSNEPLDGVRLNIGLTHRAHLLGSDVGEVSSSDNVEFTILNLKLHLTPGLQVPVSIFVAFGDLDDIPYVKTIKLNGRTICTIDHPEAARPQTTQRPTTPRPVSQTKSTTAKTVMPTRPKPATSTIKSTIPQDEGSRAKNTRPPSNARPSPAALAPAQAPVQAPAPVVRPSTPPPSPPVRTTERPSPVYVPEPAYDSDYINTVNNTRDDIRTTPRPIPVRPPPPTTEDYYWAPPQESTTTERGIYRPTTTDRAIYRPAASATRPPPPPPYRPPPPPSTTERYVPQYEQEYSPPKTPVRPPIRPAQRPAPVEPEYEPPVRPAQRPSEPEYVPQRPVQRPVQRPPQEYVAERPLSSETDYVPHRPVQRPAPRPAQRPAQYEPEYSERPTQPEPEYIPDRPMHAELDYVRPARPPTVPPIQAWPTSNQGDMGVDVDLPRDREPPRTAVRPPRPRPVLQPGCGRVAPPVTPLIVNGERSIPGKWPWHAALYKPHGRDWKYQCGGSLISPTVVVTAAHCVTSTIGRPMSSESLLVFLGKHALRTTSEDGVQDKHVYYIHVHPEYNHTNFHNDIAVLILLSPATITSVVRPVCLWDRNYTDLSNVVNKFGTVVGWRSDLTVPIKDKEKVVGWGIETDGHLTEELQQALMPIVDSGTCVYSYPLFFSVYTNNRTFCAGYRPEEPNSGTSVCNGDSGGGMFFQKTGGAGPPAGGAGAGVPSPDDVDATWMIRGLVSVSVRTDQDRCDPSHFVVFTDVAKYIDWLETFLTD